MWAMPWNRSVTSQFVRLFATKLTWEYVPTEEDTSDNDVINIAMLMTSERFQDWIAKTMVVFVLDCWIRLREAMEMIFDDMFDRVVWPGNRHCSFAHLVTWSPTNCLKLVFVLVLASLRLRYMHACIYIDGPYAALMLQRYSRQLRRLWVRRTLN